ncbi:MAG: hypothetical protein B7O98_06125 [Zestosphaera tikiterensis]|uniref:Orotidine 5'-phosphate decarboxylase domain-containing protein n=1 Tax=Zestosphaera tikiterensis TaxID=1973259 RepID=A0A2R7Y5U7_9CREN|nr:MAG: hypothetical protein B7O98_06125 [Zestosphaera tikiterensis]
MSGKVSTVGKVLELLSRRKPLLQVALDFTRLEEAARLVNSLSGLDVDIYEVGTPLIKSEGVKAVGVIKSLVPAASAVYADMKICDVGSLEVSLAHEAGADAVSVIGATDNAVIESAFNEALKRNVDLVVDLIGVREIIARIEELSKGLGIKVFEIHIGIDAQRKGLGIASVKDLIAEVKRRYPQIILAVAGGIKKDDVKILKQLGVDIVIVGGYITRSSDPRKAAEEIIAELRK